MAGGLDTLTADGWDAVFALLVRGPMLGMKHAAPLMRERGGGSIINTASIAGLQAGWGPLAYSTAKAAVIHMSRCAAAELSPQKIRVNAICPGLIATSIFGAALGMTREAADQMAAMVAERASVAQPIPKAGLPPDIASAALYLASDDSVFVTGTHLVWTAASPSAGAMPGTPPRPRHGRPSSASTRARCSRSWRQVPTDRATRGVKSAILCR